MIFFSVYAASCFVTVGKLFSALFGYDFGFFGIASPTVVNGIQQISEAGKPVFGKAGKYGLLTIISTMSWGLGYFGMPQVLLKFMSISFFVPFFAGIVMAGILAATISSSDSYLLIAASAFSKNIYICCFPCSGKRLQEQVQLQAC